MKKKPSGALPISNEICAQLYVGDYFGDTLLLSAREHAALGFLLLHIWLKGPVWRFARTAGLCRSEWKTMRDAILPLYRTAEGNIQEWKNALHAYDGKRLPPAEWYIVKTIVLARDSGVCTYCGAAKEIPTLITSCPSVAVAQMILKISLPLAGRATSPRVPSC